MTFTAPITLPGLALDPQWYRRSVFYEVMVRSFVDSNGDGTGDLGGLISKLDYLQWLGVDALWIPPIYTSPLRDGGYDVADYKAILPEFGTLDEFRELVTKAHERNMRIIIDLPMNHTSDQHEWFQQSRSDPEGPYGDFYVWSDTDEKYQNVRIIFVDTEDSNWAFDPVRRQFFFHRFFSHQPDLNFENPAVHDAMFDVVRYWLDMGVDGFRLDAIPYLYESDEGNGEGEPPTHEFIKKLRAMIDLEYPGRVMIAEANQWPAEVAAFFGTDEEPRVPHGLRLPRDAAHLLLAALAVGGRAEARALGDHRTCRRAPAGASSCATTTSSPSRWSARSTGRRCTAGTPTTRGCASNIGIRRRLAPLLDNSRAEHRARARAAVLAPRLAVPVLRRRDRHGRQHLAPRPRRLPHADAVDPGPQRRASRPPTRASSTCPSCSRWSTTTRSSTSNRSWRSRARSCTGCATSSTCARRTRPSASARSGCCETNHESVLAFVREYEGIGKPVRRRPRTHPLRVLVLPQPGRGRRSTSADLAGRGRLRPVRRRRVPAVDADGKLTLTIATQSFYWLHLGETRYQPTHL